MSELSDLYNELIRDRARGTWNVGRLPTANREGEGHNPLCGDHLHLYLRVEGDVVEDATFVADAGCAISRASASLMTEVIKGKTRREIDALFDAFHHLATTGEALPDGPELGKLEAFDGVHQFPARVKCASLAWHTLKTTLERPGEVVCTECP